MQKTKQLRYVLFKHVHHQLEEGFIYNIKIVEVAYVLEEEL